MRGGYLPFSYMVIAPVNMIHLSKEAGLQEG